MAEVVTASLKCGLLVMRIQAQLIRHNGGDNAVLGGMDTHHTFHWFKVFFQLPDNL